MTLSRRLATLEASFDPGLLVTGIDGLDAMISAELESLLDDLGLKDAPQERRDAERRNIVGGIAHDLEVTI